MKVSFSLKSKATAASSSKSVGEAPSLKKPIAFASLEDDEPIDPTATAIGGSSSKVPANKQLIAQNVGLSKSLKRQLEEEKKVDSTVFEYDEVWDKMQEAKARQKVAKEADSKERKVRMTHGFNEGCVLMQAVAKIYQWTSYIRCYAKAGPFASGREDDSARTRDGG